MTGTDETSESLNTGETSERMSLKTWKSTASVNLPLANEYIYINFFASSHGA
jgi:hypothetical protein